MRSWFEIWSKKPRALNGDQLVQLPTNSNNLRRWWKRNLQNLDGLSWWKLWDRYRGLLSYLVDLYGYYRGYIIHFAGNWKIYCSDVVKV